MTYCGKEFPVLHIHYLTCPYPCHSIQVCFESEIVVQGTRQKSYKVFQMVLGFWLLVPRASHYPCCWLSDYSHYALTRKELILELVMCSPLCQCSSISHGSMHQMRIVLQNKDVFTPHAPQHWTSQALDACCPFHTAQQGDFKAYSPACALRSFCQLPRVCEIAKTSLQWKHYISKWWAVPKVRGRLLDSFLGWMFGRTCGPRSVKALSLLSSNTTKEKQFLKNGPSVW